MVYRYEAVIEYIVGGKQYHSRLSSGKPLQDTTITIYYDPRDPSLFNQVKGLGWDGTGFMILLVTVTIVALVSK
jgi:hypothetical protein